MATLPLIMPITLCRWVEINSVVKPESTMTERIVHSHYGREIKKLHGTLNWDFHEIGTKEEKKLDLILSAPSQ
eukprot:scaffold24373_cov122-Cylindrotheca_fusiformis.AAC.2